MGPKSGADSRRQSVVSLKEKMNVNSTLGMIQEEIRFDNKLRDKVSRKDKLILEKTKDPQYLVIARIIKYFVIFTLVFGMPIF